MFGKFLLAVGLAGAAFSLYQKADQSSKNKITEFIKRVSTKLSFNDLRAIVKR